MCMTYCCAHTFDFIMVTNSFLSSLLRNSAQHVCPRVTSCSMSEITKLQIYSGYKIFDYMAVIRLTMMKQFKVRDIGYW